MTVAEQDKLESHQDQLSRLRAEVDSLRKQLQQAQRLATVGTMTAMVAHEFNNILTPIINYAQMAQKNPALREKAVLRAADGGQRASSICKAILGITRGETAQPQQVELGEMIRQTLAAMARDPKKDGIELVLDVPQELTLTTRPVELQQVLLNLLINARAAVLAKGGLKRVEVKVRPSQTAVTITVSDNGVGIPPENLEKIFQPFFSTKSSDDDSQGFGLGLSICREITESLGGEISVTSRLGEGSSFTLRLPC